MVEAEVRNSNSRGWSLTPASGCAISLLLGLLGVTCCLLAATLAVRGDVALNRGEPNEARLWLIREEGNQGLGLSFGRRLEADTVVGFTCFETQVRFFMWRSDGSIPATSYCDCYAYVGSQWSYAGSCP
ncbi:MAG: hypothetical protein GTO18_00025 [Anaerolineales bacterium]|nr:hypothetical protein [Anaerolineales bacterium]